jgi:hypothetical protein
VCVDNKGWKSTARYSTDETCKYFALHPGWCHDSGYSLAGGSQTAHDACPLSCGTCSFAPLPTPYPTPQTPTPAPTPARIKQTLEHSLLEMIP